MYQDSVMISRKMLSMICALYSVKSYDTKSENSVM